MSDAENTTAAPPAQAKKLKPARKQVKPGQVEKKDTPQTGKEYNIWYNKWAGGDREDSYSNKEKSQTRCNIKKDAGTTRADKAGGKYCCLFFARGCCPYGYECNYLHQLPLPMHALPDSSKDCFARDKFADYRDDMGGVGSFSRQNRTLYIGRIRETGNAHETEEVVMRHFKEWGEVERVKILQHRSVAFVTYVSELNAQFAREAMACQSLDNDEILNVRWATEDPNPVQKVAEKRRIEEIGQAAIASKLDPRMVDAVRSIRALEDGEEDGMSEDDEEGGAPKRQRIEQGDDDEEAPSPPPSPPAQAPPQSAGLLSAETMEGLRYFAEMRKAHAAAAPAVRSKPAAIPSVGLGGLGDYGSDDED
ncbi:hypothetical protein BOTBODRAFT_187612 [Botryobasidium botryosum FD-172 SS1]|uniref:Pre-mRNA-splicing factor CWC2 n=1 Tax=Botryobasidium botryosum (strain FD-172 SS1) TaxID=930990 RepID=A0A067MGH8_BOTB1|nr:hypothetical protein BOTBODRAFT_187612 [Botryobasidium botryosum FD-172 SS1]